MVVWRPDRFGIAQLHQLRGRVGRGRERAVCYLLSDPESPLPPATERRLKTLETLEGLGAGFAIASRDLDQRGAGDLLGEEQAGHVRLIGTGLYQHLLERALRRARGEPVPEEWSPELRLGVGIAIPEAYVPEPEIRLDLYARLARLGPTAEVDDLADEIADRFGPPPDAVRHLLAVAAIRRRCQRAGIAKLDVGPKAAAATFRDPEAAEQRLGGAVSGALNWSKGRMVLARESASEDERLAAAGELLDRLEEMPRRPGDAQQG
jgi:transcription-repair coupling factor (superfamily II helicase)